MNVDRGLRPDEHPPTGGTSITALTSNLSALIAPGLEACDARITGEWAPPPRHRQPVHTVYIPADQVTDAGIVDRWSDTALTTLTSAFNAKACDAAHQLALRLGEPEGTAREVADLGVDKLTSEPIEDLRIDFEDGFTQRGVDVEDRDADEDDAAYRAVSILTSWLGGTGGDHTLGPSFAGVRIKSFSPATRERGVRTLAILITGLDASGCLDAITNPRALRITLPKVQHHSQVEAMVDVLSHLERTLGLDKRGITLNFEVQVEAPQAILGPDGRIEAVRILKAARGRCLSLHYGTYDYSASLGIDPDQQSLEHPVADHAKDILQVACANVGVELSDGSTNRIPQGDLDSLLADWTNHHRLVTRHLRRGIRQGWDLHPNQLITRHLATVSYYRRGHKTIINRLHDYVTGTTSRWLDEPATARPMAGHLLRAHACGAVTDAELTDGGLTIDLLSTLQSS